MNKLNAVLITLGVVVSGWSGAAAAGTFDMNASSFQRSAFTSPVADDGGLCICELQNGKWVCRPVGCIGQLSPEQDPTRLLKQPVVPRVLPGDQFAPRRLPGDQYIPPSPGEGPFSRR